MRACQAPKMTTIKHNKSDPHDFCTMFQVFLNELFTLVWPGNRLTCLVIQSCRTTKWAFRAELFLLLKDLVHQGTISPTRLNFSLMKHIVSVGGVCLCLLLIEMKKERIQSAWHAYEQTSRPICWRSLFNQHASNSMWTCGFQSLDTNLLHWRAEAERTPNTKGLSR